MALRHPSSHETCYVHTYTRTTFDLAGSRQRNVAVEVVPQAILVTVHVEAVLSATAVVWLVGSPFCVRQRRARNARHKRSLRRRVSAVDVYQVRIFA